MNIFVETSDKVIIRQLKKSGIYDAFQEKIKSMPSLSDFSCTDFGDRYGDVSRIYFYSRKRGDRGYVMLTIKGDLIERTTHITLLTGRMMNELGMELGGTLEEE